MDEDILAFLEKWIEDNVRPVDALLNAEHAVALAEQFYRDAADAGFSEEEVEATVSEVIGDEDLAAYLEAALDKAEQEEPEED